MVLKFEISDPDLSLESGDTLATLLGQTIDSRPIEGIGAVEVESGHVLPVTGIAPEHLMDVVVQYLQKIPAIRQEPAQVSVSLALVRAFPCE